MKTPVSRLNDPDMQAAPVALMRACERARRLAEQTGTRFVVGTRAAPANEERDHVSRTEPDSDASPSLTPSGSS